MRIRWLLILLSSLVPAVATTNAPATNAALRTLPDGTLAIGDVRLNKKERTVTFPAYANINTETVEYAVVFRLGKAHESVFLTAVKPQEVHVGMLLLNVKPAATNRFPADLSIPPPGDPVRIDVVWTNDGKRLVRPIEDFVMNRETAKSMPRGDWIYNGSNFSEGSFTAQRDGSIVSIHIDPDALINNPRPGRDNDDLHAPNVDLVPPPNTPVEIVIRLTQASAQTPAP